MIIKHPTLEAIRTVPDGEVGRWEAAGWRRYEITSEQGREAYVPSASGQIIIPRSSDPCPMCGAQGDEPCVTFHTNKPTRRHAARVPLSEDSEES